jgi:hypothetical protein
MKYSSTEFCFSLGFIMGISGKKSSVSPSIGDASQNPLSGKTFLW